MLGIFGIEEGGGTAMTAGGMIDVTAGGATEAAAGVGGASANS